MPGGSDVPLGATKDQKHTAGVGRSRQQGKLTWQAEYVGMLCYKRARQVKTLAAKPEALSSTPGTRTVEEDSGRLHGINTPTQTHMHAPAKK